MNRYKICLYTKGKRRYVWIWADSPLEALKKLKSNLSEVAYSNTQIKEIV